MATKKTKPDKTDKPGRARERGVSATFTFELELSLDAALEAFAKKDMRTKRAVLTMALQEFLAKHGAWPPPTEPE